MPSRRIVRLILGSQRGASRQPSFASRTSPHNRTGNSQVHYRPESNRTGGQRSSCRRLRHPSVRVTLSTLEGQIQASIDGWGSVDTLSSPTRRHTRCCRIRLASSRHCDVGCVSSASTRGQRTCLMVFVFAGRTTHGRLPTNGPIRNKKRIDQVQAIPKGTHSVIHRVSLYNKLFEEVDCQDSRNYDCGRQGEGTP